MLSPLGIVVGLLVLSCGVWLCLAVIKRGWFRSQFLLGSLLAVTAVVALVLGLLSAWPRHIITLHIPRIEAKPGHIDLTRDALVLDISRRWGRAVLRVTPRNDFDEASRAELFWLDSGNLRHVAIAGEGRALATTVSGPNEWPLLVGVVEWHPKAIHVVARWIVPDGRNGGADGLHDASDPSVDGGIDNWGQGHLERIRNDRPAVENPVGDRRLK
jgi:hypothetical protein